MNIQSYSQPVSLASVSERAEFLQKTYLHLACAIFAFAGISALLFKTEIPVKMLMLTRGTRFSWLIFMGLFMIIGGIARKLARSGSSVALQYLGLGLFVVLQSLFMCPMLLVADLKAPGAIAASGVITLTTFTGLTMLVFLVKRDFTFLGRALSVAGFAAFGLILCSILFGFSLGVLFAFGMVVLASGYILYNTSNIIQHYPSDSYVAASLNLFADVALLFWYILRIVSHFTRRS